MARDVVERSGVRCGSVKQYWTVCGVLVRAVSVDCERVPYSQRLDVWWTRHSWVLVTGGATVWGALPIETLIQLSTGTLFIKEKLSNFARVYRRFEPSSRNWYLHCQGL